MKLQLLPLCDEAALTACEGPLVTSYKEAVLQEKVSSLYLSLPVTTSFITSVRSQLVLGIQSQSQTLAEKDSTPKEFLDSTILSRKKLGNICGKNSEGAQTSILNTNIFVKDSRFEKVIQAVTICFNWCLEAFPET